MQAQFKITFIGGEEIEVTSSLVDMVRCEKYTGVSVTESAVPSLTQLTYIAYSAAVREGKAGQDYEKWLELVSDIGEVDAPAPKAKPSKG